MIGLLLLAATIVLAGSGCGGDVGPTPVPTHITAQLHEGYNDCLADSRCSWVGEVPTGMPPRTRPDQIAPGAWNVTIAPRMLCRICSCGLPGTHCWCRTPRNRTHRLNAGPRYADTGRNTECGSCRLPRCNRGRLEKYTK